MEFICEFIHEAELFQICAESLSGTEVVKGTK